jgi:hypothetical protein
VKSAFRIEMAKVNRMLMVVVDGCGADDLERLTAKLRALDPERQEFWKIEDCVLGSFDEIIMVSAPSAVAVQRHVRAYVQCQRAAAVRS